jgi:hypothetical protein
LLTRVFDFGRCGLIGDYLPETALMVFRSRNMMVFLGISTIDWYFLTALQNAKLLIVV